MGNKMRKGFTLIEVLIVLVILGIITAIFLGRGSRFNVAERCLSKGYVVATTNGYNSRYCTKVQNGNTVVIHVDSIR
jgi:prepilin-type N-terminal cleavage/methylation domain-containing protein